LILSFCPVREIVVVYAVTVLMNRKKTALYYLLQQMAGLKNALGAGRSASNTTLLLHTDVVGFSTVTICLQEDFYEFWFAPGQLCDYVALVINEY